MLLVHFPVIHFFPGKGSRLPFTYRISSLTNMETNNSTQKSGQEKLITQSLCELCDFKTVYRRNFLLHMRRVHNKHDLNSRHEPLPCASCDYVCYDLATLIRHNRMHTGERPYECYFCDKNFRQFFHLTAHEKIHTKERHYQCGFCAYTADFKKKLTMHHLRHHGKLPWPSTRRCHWATLQEGHRILQEKPHECRFCNYRCGDMEQLTQHEHRHALKSPFKCRRCPFDCDQLSALKFHEDKEHGQFQRKSPEKILEAFHGKN